MKKLLIFLLLIPISLSAQEKYFHELKGMEDSTGTTHLFYRIFDSETDYDCCINWTNNVTHFNSFTLEDSIVFESLSQTPIGSPSNQHDKFIDDYLFIEKDLLSPFWITNSGGDWSNQFSYINGYNESFFYSGPNWADKIGYGKNDTLSFIAKNYDSKSALIVLEKDSLPSIRYPYPILVKINPEEPLCFENGECFYGASDSVRFLNYNFLEVDPYQKNMVYLTRNDSLFITSDLGNNIVFLNDQFVWNNIGSLLFSPNSSSIIAMTENRYRVNGELLNFPNYQLLQSLNGGHTWQEIYSDTLKIYVNSLSSSYFPDFYMGVGKTLYYWDQLSGQFGEVDFFETEITGIFSPVAASKIYVLTKESLYLGENDVWGFISIKKLPLNNKVIQEIPTSITLHQNYPNPFNPSTTISFELDKPSEVTLTVFDALGRTIAALVNEQKSTGLHTVDFDASNLSSGIYFYRLEAGEFVKTKRLTLIK